MPSLRKIPKYHTKIRQEGEDTIIKLYSTDVVKFNANQITLDTGGWHTMTTRNRMNQASYVYGLGYYVSYCKGRWSCYYRGRDYQFTGRNAKCFLSRSLDNGYH